MTENRDRPEWLVPIFFYLEASSKQPQTGLALLFLSVLGTRTLPTGTLEPSSRGKTVWNRCQTGLWPIPGRSLARGPCPQLPRWHLRVAKMASIGTLARGPSTEALLRQGRVAKGRESVPLTGLRSGSRPCSARHPRLQVVLRQGRVAKGTSIGTLARGPCPEMPQWHPRGATVSWCIGD